MRGSSKRRQLPIECSPTRVQNLLMRALVRSHDNPARGRMGNPVVGAGDIGEPAFFFFRKTAWASPTMQLRGWLDSRAHGLIQGQSGQRLLWYILSMQSANGGFTANRGHPAGWCMGNPVVGTRDIGKSAVVFPRMAWTSPTMQLRGWLDSKAYGSIHESGQSGATSWRWMGNPARTRPTIQLRGCRFKGNPVNPGCMSLIGWAIRNDQFMDLYHHAVDRMAPPDGVDSL